MENAPSSSVSDTIELIRVTRGEGSIATKEIWKSQNAAADSDDYVIHVHFANNPNNLRQAVEQDFLPYERVRFMLLSRGVEVPANLEIPPGVLLIKTDVDFTTKALTDDQLKQKLGPTAKDLIDKWNARNEFEHKHSQILSKLKYVVQRDKIKNVEELLGTPIAVHKSPMIKISIKSSLWAMLDEAAKVDLKAGTRGIIVKRKSPHSIIVGFTDDFSAAAQVRCATIARVRYQLKVRTSDISITRSHQSDNFCCFLVFDLCRHSEIQRSTR